MRLTHFLLAATAAAALTGCIAEPGPYYGGVSPYYNGYAPYYGTTVAPAYVGVYSGGYYPYYPYHHIHSGYSNGYWPGWHGGYAHRGAYAAAHTDGHAGSVAHH